MAERLCPWWLAYSFDNPLRPIFHKPEKIFDGLVKPGMVVADIGCGLGYFSIGLASMVGPEGRVIAIDLQPQMLARMERRVYRAGMADRVHAQRCNSGNIGITEKLDFALAFWVVHETPSVQSFYLQVFEALRNGGRLLIAEPKVHVKLADFQKNIALSEEIGFRVVAFPQVAFSNAAVLEKRI